MKILEVNTEKTWRGGERQTLFALKGFSLLNHEVHLLARKNFPLAQKAKEENFKCYEVQNHLAVIPFLIKYGEEYDVIHVQTASLLTFAVLTKPFHKGKIVYTRRLDFVPKGRLTLWKYKNADLIIAISQPIKVILQKFGVKKVEIIPECIEEKRLDVARAKALLKNKDIEGKKIIGTTAALVQHKDPQTLVKAIAELKKTRDDFVLLHFGEGPLQLEIESLIKRFNLEKFYYLLGFHNNVEDFFSVFDVFVMSSEEEGLGSSVLDAFIYKVPVVSTNAGGLAEIVKDRGVLVPIKDPEQLAKALDATLSLKIPLSIENAYRFTQKELNLKSIHIKYIDTFMKLLNIKN